MTLQFLGVHSHLQAYKEIKITYLLYAMLKNCYQLTITVQWVELS